MFSSSKYKSLCNWSTRNMTCVLSALSRGCLACHFPHCRHNTTGFMNNKPTILYPRTNLYLQKFWPEIPKLSQVQICFQVQDCWHMVHKTSCIMPYTGENVDQDSPCWVQPPPPSPSRKIRCRGRSAGFSRIHRGITPFSKIDSKNVSVCTARARP